LGWVGLCDVGFWVGLNLVLALIGVYFWLVDLVCLG